MNISEFKKYENALEDLCVKIEKENDTKKLDSLVTKNLDISLKCIGMDCLGGAFNTGGLQLAERAAALQQKVVSTLLKKESEITDKEVKRHIHTVADHAAKNFQEVINRAMPPPKHEWKSQEDDRDRHTRSTKGASKMSMKMEESAHPKKTASQKTVGEEAILHPGVAKKLTPSDIDAIVTFVKENPSLLAEKKPGRNVPFKKTDQKIPRSIIVQTPGKEEKIENTAMYILTKSKVIDATGSVVKMEEEVPSGFYKVKKDVLELKGRNIRFIAEISLHKRHRGTPRGEQELRKEYDRLKDFQNLPHVVQVVGAVKGPSKGTKRVISKILEVDYRGGTLKEALENTTMSIDTKRTCIGDILEGVKGIHEKGYIHSDLKEGNVLLDDKGRAYVGDFGLSYKKGESWKSGTVRINAPETFDATFAHLQGDTQAYFKLGQLIDSFSMGMIMCDLLLGKEWTKDPSDICMSIAHVLEGTASDDELELLQDEKIITHTSYNPDRDKEEVVTYLKTHKAADIYAPYVPDYSKVKEGDLMKKLLALDPAKRISIPDAHTTWKQTHPS